MYAVVNIAGHQVKVDKGLRLRVPRLQVEEGSTQEFTEVLLVADEGETKVGNPTVEGASVSATVVGHGRGDKIIVFKKKKRKKYRRRNGHRQDYTEIQVEDIVLPN
jgi:large subunit ribosomal protein L21